jgi:hypothetical protein
VEPSAVRSLLPPQFTGPVGADIPWRLLSLPQPVNIRLAATVVETAVTNALPSG